jgi:hypothetical protein
MIVKDRAVFKKTADHVQKSIKEVPALLKIQQEFSMLIILYMFEKLFIVRAIGHFIMLSAKTKKKAKEMLNSVVLTQETPEYYQYC